MSLLCRFFSPFFSHLFIHNFPDCLFLLQFSIEFSIIFFVVAGLFYLSLHEFFTNYHHFQPNVLTSFFHKFFQSYLFAGKIIKTLVQYNTIITITANNWEFILFFLSFSLFFFFLAFLSLRFSFGFSFFSFFWRR